MGKLENYNGTNKAKFSIQKITKDNIVEECKDLLDMIDKYEKLEKVQ